MLGFKLSVSKLIFILLWMLILSNTALAVQGPGPRLGVNVGGLHKLSTALPFTDLFKNSRGWFTSCEFNWQTKRAIDPGCTAKNSFNTHEQSKLALDRNGYVRSLPGRNSPVIYTSVTSGLNLEEDFPLGRYVLLYSGLGDLKVQGGLNIIEERPGRIVFDLISTRMGLKVKISSTKAGNHIRDIHLVAAHNENTFRQRPFNPDYIARMRPFQSIRFMPWTNPRATKLVHWNQHPTPDFVNYTADGGVPVETMIDIANAANAAPWLNMPHMASDGFMREYARMARRRVTGNKKIYIEFSNEMWNVIFPATSYAIREAMKLWPNAYASKNSYERRVKLANNWYGKRSVEMCNIWKQVFGNQKNRVVCVIASQSNVDWVGKEALDCPLWAGGPCGSKVDAYAVGPYFGDYIAKLPHRAEVNNWANRPDGMNLLFREIEQGGVLRKGPKGGAIQHFVNSNMKTSMKLADDYGLPLLAYEAGQHLIRYDRPHKVTDPKLLDFFMRANQDPRMKRAYQRYLQAWEQNGGKTLMHFYGIGKPSREDFFGMLSSPKQTHSAKYDAMLQYMGTRYKDSYQHQPPLSAQALAERRGAVQKQLSKAQLKRHPSGRPMSQK